MHVLVVSSCAHHLPVGTCEMLRENGWQVTNADDYRSATHLASAGGVDAVIVAVPATVKARSTAAAELDCLLRVLQARRIFGLVIADGQESRLPHDASLLEAVDRRIAPAELRGRLAMVARYHGLLRALDAEMSHMQRLGISLSEHFREVDQEMRLAARLQRDFLPNLDSPIGNVHFAALYRPVSWVSGDLFDVFRVNEQFTGFYVADVVGHGMAAGLLTMFIKRALVAKHPGGIGEPEILTPSQTLSELNQALIEQGLPNCQFVTACYGLFDHHTRTLQIARAGHPLPILILADGSIHRIEMTGGLLGIFADMVFPTATIRLQPGDKLLLYTDGLDALLSSSATARHSAVNSGGGSDRGTDHLKAMASLPIQALLAELEALLDGQTGSLFPHDDVTAMGLEVLDTVVCAQPLGAMRSAGRAKGPRAR